MKNFLLQFGLVLAVFGGIGLFFCRQDIGYAFSQPVDINVDYPEDYNDVKAVKTDIYMLLDYFAELETTTEKNGAITDRDYTYYYIMPVYTVDDTYYVGVEVSEEDDDDYDHIADLTWEYLMAEETNFGNESVAFEGGFIDMEDELYKYYIEWFEDAEWFESDAEMEKYALPLLLKPAKLDNTKTLIIVCGALLVVGLGMFIYGLTPSKKKKDEAPAPTRTTVEINGISYPISNFENVNKNIVEGKTTQALKEIQQITGLGVEEAKGVVDNWGQYWS